MKNKPEFVLTKNTPYFALTDELWSVYWEDLGENWLRYNRTALYMKKNIPVTLIENLNKIIDIFTSHQGVSAAKMHL